MRLFTTISILILFACMVRSYAQTIEIADPNFRTCLAERYSYLINQDGHLIIDSARVHGDSLICTGKAIKEVPELVYFESITHLLLNQNELTTLPSLDNLKELRFFYVAENKLTEIPPVDSLKNLEEFITWRNQLTDLPDLTMLHKLHRLDVPVNRLTTFPVLSPIAPMRILLVDDNFITDLPDLSIYPDLTIVKLVNNQLSFDDLDIILEQPKPGIYDYYPQKIFEVLESVTVDEGDSIVLSVPIDQSNPDVIIRWMQDNTFLSYEGDRLGISNAHPGLSGTYRAVLSSGIFSNKPLYTNTVSVQVRSCPDPNLVDPLVQHADCLEPGAITINMLADSSYTFSLTDSQHNELSPEANTFENLSHGSYNLQVIHSSGCSKAYANPLMVETMDCKEVLLSPNNDGYQDSFYFEESGRGVIRDKFGNPIHHIDLPAEWNGQVAGKNLSPGYYTLDINNGEELIGITIVY